MARRWVCPNCGSGVNGPERPRRNSIVRYCLECSKTAGVLVERTVPSLERQRTAARAKTAERQKAERQRAREAKLTRFVDAAGNEHKLDAEKIVQRALRDCGATDDVEIVLRHRAYGTSGHAWPDAWPRPRITITHGHELESFLEVAYHEAAHIAAGYDRADTKHWHGPRFRSKLADALQKRWPFLVYGSVYNGGAYDADARIEEQMREHVKTGGKLL